jgi:glucuronate isomerase
MQELTQRLFLEIVKIPIIDPHTHVDPRRPVARDLDDLLGYHYYTELAHSAGMSRDQLRTEIPAEERARAVAGFLHTIENTVQYGWILEMARNLFGFRHEKIDAANFGELWKLAESHLTREGWARDLAARSNIEKVFLTNDFDDPLEGFDTSFYVPCLRTDDLVFRLGDPAVAERLRQSSGKDVGNAASVKEAMDSIFRKFLSRGARACAIALPPDFAPEKIDASRADHLLRRLLSGAQVKPEEQLQVSHFVFWSIAELCREHRVPFDLMIGVHRNVYAAGVHQGRDLLSRLVSLYPFRALFNEFPEVVFPVSVLASDANPELVAFSWIFPNVVASGHWWYSGVPAFIEADLRARLQAVPRTKQIGYYSDAYKLEFVLPKYNMYRRCLARVLAADFVEGRGWSEEKAVALARDLLRGNAERIFLAKREK